MQNSRKMLSAGWLAGVLAVSVSTIAGSSFPPPQAQGNAEVTSVNAGAGPCTADFAVNDFSGKGIYDAKIRIQLKYGFHGIHSVDATVGTNYQGKARIEGLPDKIKGTAEFKISHADETKSLTYDPLADCHPSHEVILQK